jgi:hypothetical protein
MLEREKTKKGEPFSLIVLMCQTGWLMSRQHIALPDVQDELEFSQQDCLVATVLRGETRT